MSVVVVKAEQLCDKKCTAPVFTILDIPRHCHGLFQATGVPSVLPLIRLAMNLCGDERLT